MAVKCVLEPYKIKKKSSFKHPFKICMNLFEVMLLFINTLNLVKTVLWQLSFEKLNFLNAFDLKTLFKKINKNCFITYVPLNYIVSVKTCTFQSSKSLL